MVTLNRIYTRTGDDGTTGLVGTERRLKCDVRIDAYGTVDEANAAIGLVRMHTISSHPAIDVMLARIQNDLFDVGADLATPHSKEPPKYEPLRATQPQVEWVEKTIDTLNADLKPLKSFVLPGGTPGAAALHLARTITRRAERLAVELAQTEQVNPLAIHYLNRLSDFLFVASRSLNDNGALDVLWVPGANR
jgi:cob(I)alamin adenosyltransferase